MPQILNANDLPTGDVIYWTGNRWSRLISEAQVVEDADAATAVGAAALAAQLIVDPYLIDVTLEKGTPWPVLKREQIRASGPTVRADLARPTGA